MTYSFELLGRKSVEIFDKVEKPTCGHVGLIRVVEKVALELTFGSRGCCLWRQDHNLRQKRDTRTNLLVYTQ